MYPYFILLSTNIQIEILEKLYNDLLLLSRLRKCAKIFDELYRNDYLWFRIMSLKYPHYCFNISKPLLSTWRETASKWIEELHYPMANIGWNITEPPEVYKGNRLNPNDRYYLIHHHFEMVFRGPMTLDIPYFVWDCYNGTVLIDKEIITEREIIETISNFYHQELDMKKLDDKVSDKFKSILDLANNYFDDNMVATLNRLRSGQKVYHYELFDDQDEFTRIELDYKCNTIPYKYYVAIND